MSVSPGLTVQILPNKSFFRITSQALYTTDPADHVTVVNGQGSVNSWNGGRYNARGVVTVYLTEDIETCFAEKMFYFQRGFLNALDSVHLVNIGAIPPYTQRFVLWEVKFRYSIRDVFDLTIPHAHTQFNVFPSLTLNPHQDYKHLADKRADIQSSGYNGIRVPSSRTTNGGNIIVLFHDQSSNVLQIDPYEVEFQLIVKSNSRYSTSFANHGNDILDFTSGNVRILPRPSPPLSFRPQYPTGGQLYRFWQRVTHY
jgi:RES domain-containing protein